MAKTITTIVRKNDKCVIYNDDGMFCNWTDVQDFNFDLISNVKAGNSEWVMLISEEEAQAFTGNKNMTMENHNAWVISKDILWILEGRFEPRASEEKLINFFKQHMI